MGRGPVFIVASPFRRSAHGGYVDLGMLYHNTQYSRIQARRSPHQREAALSSRRPRTPCTNLTGIHWEPTPPARTALLNQATKVAPYDLCRVCDVGDTPIRSPFHLESSLDEIAQAFARLHDAGVVPIAAGGDHSITLPIFAQLMIRALSGLDLVGGDVVEVAPPFDPSGNTALVGATMMFEILCVVAQARSAAAAAGKLARS